MRAHPPPHLRTGLCSNMYIYFNSCISAPWLKLWPQSIVIIVGQTDKTWQEFIHRQKYCFLFYHWKKNISLSVQFDYFISCSGVYLIEPLHDKTSKMAYVPSEDSDQLGHLPSLIRVFVVRMKKHRVLSYPLNAQWRLVRLHECADWSESSLGSPVFVFVLSCAGSVWFSIK